MANITYVSNGKALEYTIPDNYINCYVGIIPFNAEDVQLTFCSSNDYIVLNGVIRFYRPLPEGTKIILTDSIYDVMPEGGSASMIETSLDNLGEAILDNTLAIADLSEKHRTDAANFETRITALESTGA